MSDQLELGLRQSAPAVDQAELAAFLQVLRSEPRWFSSAELKVMGWTDRQLREIAEQDIFADIYSYPGSPGYKAYEHVTEEELLRCEALKNQAKKMYRRYLRYYNRRHKGRRR